MHAKKTITTRYLPWTNTKPTRIAAFTADGNRLVYKTEDSCLEPNTHMEATKALCRKMGWKGTIVQGWLRCGEYAHVFTDPTTPKAKV